MPHSAFRDRLIALAGATTQDPGGFLEGLSSIHDDWHTEVSRGYGFLLFHNRVVRSFNAIVAPGVDPAIEPFTEQEFQDMGVEAFQEDASNVTTLSDLVAFSTAIESWHNTAHMAIAMATGTPMMDPRQNIFFRAFWQLHLFIDDVQFAKALQQYGDRAHPGQFVIPSAIAGHIEARHHGWVPRI
jgi:hypothetical protein